MNKMTLGEAVRDARERSGRSLRDVAKEAEISPTFLSDVELDRRLPAPAILEAISVAVGLPASYFEPWDDRRLIQKFKSRLPASYFDQAMHGLLYGVDDLVLLTMAEAWVRFAQDNVVSNSNVNVIVERCDRNVLSLDHPLNVYKTYVDDHGVVARNPNIPPCAGKHFCEICSPESEREAAMIGASIPTLVPASRGNG